MLVNYALIEGGRRMRKKFLIPGFAIAIATVFIFVSLALSGAEKRSKDKDKPPIKILESFYPPPKALKKCG